MPHLGVGDRIKETTTTTGTGTIDLAGAVEGYQTFVAGIGNGHETYYSISNRDADEWEVGYGTITDAVTDTLSRTTVISSSNGGSLVNFSAGTKDVICTLPADKSFVIDGEANVAISANLSVTGGATFTGSITANNSSGGSSIIIDSATASDSSLFFNDAGSNSYNIFKDGSQSDDLRIISYGDTAGNTDILRYAKNGSLKFQTAASDRVTIDSSGNVGIGTSSPSSPLEVNGTITAGSLISAAATDLKVVSGGNATTNGSNIIFYGGSHATEPNVLKFRYGTTETMRIDSSGNVGIGTSSPSGNLVVQASAVRSANSNYNQIVAEKNGNSGVSILSGTTSQGGLVFGDADQNNIASVRYDHSADEMVFDVNGSRALTIDSSRNLGINTTSPTSLLDINSSGPSTTPVRIDASTGSGSVVWVENSGSDFYQQIRDTSGTTKVQLNSDGVSYFSGGDVTIGATGGGHILTVNGTTVDDFPLKVTGTPTGSYLYQEITSQKATANSIGTAIEFRALSTTQERQTGVIVSEWTNNVDASRTSQYRFNTASGGTSATPLTLTGADATFEGSVYLSSGSASLGIGTTSPQDYYSGASQLVIYDGSEAGITIRAGTTSLGRLHFADGTTGNAAYRGYIYYDHSVDGMYFGTSATSRMTIASDGDVGIGTTGPNAKLDVKSQINVTNSNNISLPAVLGSEYGYSSSYKTVVLGPTGTTTSDNIAIGYDPSVNASGSFSGNGSELLFRNGISFLTPNSTDTGYHRNNIVLKDGNVGIGTTSPNTRLDVEGTGVPLEINSSNSNTYKIQLKDNGTITGYIGSSSASPIRFADASATELMRIDSSGDVGIGTTNPSRGDYGLVDPKLHVDSTGSSGTFTLVSRFESGGDADNTGGAILINHENDRGILIEGGRQSGDQGVGHLGIVTSSGSHSRILTLLQGGNVGIGTTTPSAVLDVRDETNGANFIVGGSGTTNITKIGGGAGDSLQLFTNSTTPVMILSTSGNVGIGTASPAQTLDVNGTILTDKAYIALATLTDGATINWNMSTQSVAKVTLGGNRTIAAPTNGSTGQFASITVIQDVTGSRTLTWNAVYEFKDDTAPTLTTTGGKGDLFVFQYNGTKWLEVGRNLNLTQS